jgi:hypothetical protein
MLFHYELSSLCPPTGTEGQGVEGPREELSGSLAPILQCPFERRAEMNLEPFHFQIVVKFPKYVVSFDNNPKTLHPQCFSADKYAQVSGFLLAARGGQARRDEFSGHAQKTGREWTACRVLPC